MLLIPFSISYFLTYCFNHQTVYRMLYGKAPRSFDTMRTFQSPNGVQNAFLRICAFRALSVMFQSPNGVQNALMTTELTSLVSKFQSPNGVQNAFLTSFQPRLYLPGFNHQTVYRMLCGLDVGGAQVKNRFNHQTVYRML